MPLERGPHERLRKPLVPGRVLQQAKVRAAGVARVCHGQLSRQHPRDPVMDEANTRGGPRQRPVAAEPEERAAHEAAGRHAAAGIPGLRRDALEHQVEVCLAVRGGGLEAAAILPGDQVSERPIVRIHAEQTVHLASKPDTGHVGPKADLEPSSFDFTEGAIVIRKPGVLLTEEYPCTDFSQLEIGMFDAEVRQGNSSRKQG